MELRVSAPGKDLKQDDIDRIERDLDKIDRRLNKYQNVFAEVRITGNNSVPDYHVTLEVKYRNVHLIAKTHHADYGQAIREAREEILRQINDRSRGSHSSYAKGR